LVARAATVSSWRLAASLSVASSPAKESVSWPALPVDGAGGNAAVWAGGDTGVGAEVGAGAGAGAGLAAGAGAGAGAGGSLAAEVAGMGPAGVVKSDSERGGATEALCCGGAGAGAGGGAAVGGDMDGTATAGGGGAAAGGRTEGALGARLGARLGAGVARAVCSVFGRDGFALAVARGFVARGGCRLTLPVARGGAACWDSSAGIGWVRRPSGVDGTKLRRPPIIMSGTLGSGPSESSTLMSTVTLDEAGPPPTTTVESWAKTGVASAAATRAK